jgi:hypothetical protein
MSEFTIADIAIGGKPSGNYIQPVVDTTTPWAAAALSATPEAGVSIRKSSSDIAYTSALMKILVEYRLLDELRKRHRESAETVEPTSEGYNPTGSDVPNAVPVHLVTREIFEKKVLDELRRHAASMSSGEERISDANGEHYEGIDVTY